MTTIRTRPDITAADRLGLTLFLAATVHALIILGISFSTLGKKPFEEIINTLDITLVQTHTEQAPENADYLAQANQEGGGTTRERIRTRSPDSKPDLAQQEGTAEQPRPQSSPELQQAKNSPVLSARNEDFRMEQSPHTPKPEQLDRTELAQIMKSSHAIVRQSSEVSPEWQAYGRQPDPNNLFANTRKHAASAYIDAWTRKVERIGNLNYPDEARRQRLSGSLTLEVTLHPDGSLQNVSLLRSSGHKILDDAAKRIVRLASPFDKVPGVLLGKNNSYRFPRTWAFTTNNHVVSR